MSSNQSQPTPDSPTTSKAYQPSAVEPRVSAKWDASGAFHADPQTVLRGEKQPYCILIPPPNVTGALHLGHALNNTLQDILTRAHRMMGFETLWMPGTDHAGIATQAVVERRLRKEGKLKGPLKTSMTREQFVEQVQSWKDEYEARITGQLKAMGCSCDYARQRFTMDPICARAVREAFFRLFKDGLIYRGKRLVNWDPVLQTAVADDECYDEEVESSFWYLRYPVVRVEAGQSGKVAEWQSGKVKEPAGSAHSATLPLGHSATPVTWDELATRGYPGAEQHPGDQPAWVTVATTRPETYLGDTAVAVSPKDVRAKALRGLHVELPLVGRVIPIIEDDYVVLPAAQWEDEEAAKGDPKAQYATGFLKVTPAHDPNDYELGLRHKLPMINVMAPDATISDKYGWSDPRELEGAHVFLHKPREEARKLVVREFEARGLLEKPRPYRHSVKHSDRSKAIIEPYLSDQWFVRVTDDRLSGAANRALVPEQRSAPDRTTGASARTGVPNDHTGPNNAYSQAQESQAKAGASQAKAHDAQAVAQGPQAEARASQAMAHGPRATAQGPQATASASQAKAGESRAMAQESQTLAGGSRAEGGGSPARGSGSAAAGGDSRTWPGDGSMRFYPARYAKTYEQWHDNIRDWCISRQLWWGHRIPVWTRTTGFDGFPEGTLADIRHLASAGRSSSFPANPKIKLDAHDSAVFYEVDEAKRQVKTFVSFREDRPATISAFERDGYERDPDVLDTWFSSALWPLSTMGWPEPEQSKQTRGVLAAFNPTSVLSTAREIITLWVSRMVMMNRYFRASGEVAEWQSGKVSDSAHSATSPLGHSATPPPPGSGPVPFHDVFIHAVVQDGEGRKMSKSLNNGVDPLDIIESHGADAMRFTLAQMTTNTQDVRMPVKPDPRTGKNTSEKFDAGRAFCNKLWNASRYAIGVLQGAPGVSQGSAAAASGATDGSTPSLRSGLLERWMLSRLARAVGACEASLKGYEFSDYCQTIYQLLWWDFCDWYLEGIKPTVDGSASQQAVLRTGLDVILRLLHPVAPFITEALFEQLAAVPQRALPGIEMQTRGLLCVSDWPRVDASLVDAKAEEQFEELRSIVSAIRNVRSEHQVPPKRRVVLHCSAAMAAEMQAAAPGLVEHLAGLASVSTAKPAGAHVAFRAAGEEMLLSDLADAIDAGAEKERLTKQLADLRKSEGALHGRLSNPGYAEKAPAKLVAESRAQLDKIRGEIAAIEEKLKAL